MIKPSILLLLALATLVFPAAAVDEAEFQKKVEAIDMPGITINAKERFIDVDCKVCLDAGALELVACTPDTKEHESIVVVQAKPVHIHLGLLLIGARNGSPSQQRLVGEGEEKRIQFIMAHGHPVDVLLVVADEDGKEQVRPIGDFIQRVEEDPAFTGGQVKDDGDEEEKFPTSTFLFLGSHLMGNGEGPRRYLAEESGNVISISTFGDEVLGLPMEFSHANGDLMWEVNPELMPKAGTKVKLRLKPVFKAPEPPAAAGETPKSGE